MTNAPTRTPTPLEAIRAGYLARAQARVGKDTKRGVIRISGCGHQPRRQAFTYFPDAYPGEVLTDRSMRYFEVGDQRHDGLRQAMIEGGIIGDVPVVKSAEREVEIPIPGTTWILRGHPDGVVDTMVYNGTRYDDVLLEIKTAGSAGWRRVLDGEVDEKYLAQAMLYCKARRLKWVCFIYERKDTQDLHMFFVPYDEDLANKVLEDLKTTIDAIEAGFDPMTLPECSGTDYGWVMRKQPKVLALGWRCSYCSFAVHCFPTHVRHVVSGKPICVDVSSVPPDAYVVSHGVDVVPRASWKMGGANATEEAG